MIKTWNFKHCDASWVDKRTHSGCPACTLLCLTIDPWDVELIDGSHHFYDQGELASSEYPADYDFGFPDSIPFPV